MIISIFIDFLDTFLEKCSFLYVLIFILLSMFSVEIYMPMY